LEAIDFGPVSPTTSRNDFRMGLIHWVTNPTQNTDTDFNNLYTLTLLIRLNRCPQASFALISRLRSTQAGTNPY
jgi:hypothetical protein